MKPEAQRIAIAKVCGWIPHDEKEVHAAARLFQAGPWWRLPSENTIGTADQLPDYLNDLNATHEAIVALTFDLPDGTKLFNYRCALTKVCGGDNDLILYATAAQQSEAFLRALGLWTDD